MCFEFFGGLIFTSNIMPVATKVHVMISRSFAVLTWMHDNRDLV